MESEPKPGRARRRRSAPREVRRRRLLALGGLAAAAVGIAAAVVVLVLFVFGGGDGGDGHDIEALARHSIEVLPAGEWPSLYNSFTSEFQARCSREEFTKAGQEGAIALGDDLQFLRFMRIEDLAINGPNGRAVIVGEILGKPGSVYKRRALFLKVNGEWKLAPVSDSKGCQAFGLPAG